MNEVPTAEEFLMQESGRWPRTQGVVAQIMTEFAKLHVKAALAAAAENHVKLSATKDTIRNSYPEDLIK